MTSLRLFLIATAFSFSSVCYSQTNDWQLLSTDNFEILFPATPTKTVDFIDNDFGTMEAHSYLHISQENPDESILGYMIITTEFNFPLDSVYNKVEEDISTLVFESTINEMLISLDSELLSESDSELAGFPGKKYKIRMNQDSLQASMYMFLVKEALYVLICYHREEIDNKELANKFFHSFAVKLRMKQVK